MATCALTGTGATSLNETLVKTDGTKTTILTLTSDTWPAAAASGQAFSDDFNRGDSDSLGANWTEVGGDIDIASNTLSFVAGSFTTMIAVYNTQTNTVDQYVKYQPISSGAYLGAVLRYTDASSDYYNVINTGGTNFGWYSYTSPGVGEAEQGTPTALTGFSSSHYVGVTVVGTGTNTVVRVWLDPSGDTPDAGGATWGSSSPAITWTSDPSNAVDTGNYVGVGGSQSAGPTNMDNFFGGDVP